ncbi:pre-mRNA-splicing factor CWC22 homolog [Trichogramma pretiosum]|uniref:pre-mRNA-splicing factor CWC22 homolog n=1 Tax=Trichogramma pretiosum TaxID=7493 RepID=UPI0006C9719F|nr:pre-mRNA-splicing factor CWC22 homolog [Trichogramma pretiosum]
MSGVEKKSDNNKKRHRKSSSLRKHRKRHRSTSSETNDIRYERSGSIGEKERRHRRSSSSDNSEKRNERSGSTCEKERRRRRSSSSNTSEKRNERSRSMDRNKKRHERSTSSDTNKKKYEKSKSKNENKKRHERSRSIDRNKKEHNSSSSDTSTEKHERSGSVEKTKKRHKKSGSKDKNNKRHRRSSSSDSNDKRYERSGSMDKNKKSHKRRGSISRNEKRYKRHGSTSRNEKRYKRNGSADKNDKKHRRSISSDTNDKRYERSRSIDENNQKHKRNESLGTNNKRSEGSRPRDENDKRYERRETIDRNERRYRRSTSIEANEKRCKRSRSRDHDENRYTTNSSVGRKDGMSNVNEIGYENVGPKPIKKEELLTTKTGGAYIPPAKLRLMQAELKDKSSSAYQRIAWEALKKSIHGFINKVNTSNIGPITRDLLKENIVRGRGLLARSIIQAQAASPTFTPVYAALVAVINSKFPNIGELIVKRLAIQFKRGFKRNSKVLCISSATFIAHLVNQGVAHEILILEILTLLVQTPTDDSIEIAIAILKEVGMKLTQVCRKGIEAIFEMLRNILHEGHLDKRVQYMIEVVFQIRKDGFKDHEAVNKDLDLVEEEDQMTHLIALDEATDSQDILNVFKFDAEYLTNEEKYKELSKDILNSDSDDDDDDEGSDEEDDEDEDEEDEKTESGGLIIDNTETNLTALRRTIYLTIHSSLDFEECAHKLLKMQLKPGQEMELCHMFLDCCAEMRTYEKFFGLLAGRFCAINRIYVGPFEEIFRTSYNTIHRLDTNRLRNVAKFFAHLLMTDSISWAVLSEIKLNEDDTTSSSRVFIKILFQELSEYMGLPKLNDKLKDEEMQEAFNGLFPKDDPRNTRFAINFFTSIGLGGLTDDLREFLKNRPKKDVPLVKKEP